MVRKSLTDLGEEPSLDILRPLVEAYLAFLRKSDTHIRTMGLTPSQFDVVVTLGDSDGISCKEVSNKTLVTKGTLTGILDRLESKGLIERVPSKEDRRSMIIRLTTQGNSLFQEVFPKHISFLRPYFERAFTPAEMKTFHKMLLNLKESFERS